METVSTSVDLDMAPPRGSVIVNMAALMGRSVKFSSDFQRLVIGEELGMEEERSPW